MFLQNQFEPPSEGAGSHGQVGPMAAEDVVLRGQLSALVEYQLPLAERAVFFQQTGHLQGEVHVPIPGGGLWFFHKDVLPRDLHHIPAYMDGLLGKIHVLPLQTAAFPSPHPRGNNEFEVGFVLDALLLQRSDETLGSFLIRYVALFLLFPGVFVGAPSWILRQKTALHGIGENTTQAGVDSLNGALGERFSRHRVLLFPQLGIEIAEVLRL